MALSANLAVNSSCTAYDNLKMSKNVEFVIFKANDSNKEIVVDFEATLGSSQEFWDDYGANNKIVREKDEPVEYWNMRRMILESKEPRYAVIFIQYPTKNKLIMIFWCPGYSVPRLKMVYSSTKNDFKNRLEGIQGIQQCNDMDELSYAEIYKAYSKA